jgi:hypothetical protein
VELLATIAALIGVLAAGIIYGTDAFCAWSCTDTHLSASVGRHRCRTA